MKIASLLALAIVLLTGGVALADKPLVWAAVKTPTAGAAQAVGTPAAGCLLGGQQLDLDGGGWSLARPERGRNYAHPDVIQYVHWLGARVQEQDLGRMIVGDLSQPRGGPMSYGHGSHQNGLDVDIFFYLTDGPIASDLRRNPPQTSMVQGQGVNKSLWTDKTQALLQLAASAPQVERIFVNPAIKAHLCRTLPSDQRQWLHKLRPWWGHDEHFHVRLGCPLDSPECVPQPPPPEGDGCGAEVESWLDRPTLNIPSDKPNTRNVTLPQLCRGAVRSARQDPR